jgi:hypothetical protein
MLRSRGVAAGTLALALFVGSCTDGEPAGDRSATPTGSDSSASGSSAPAVIRSADQYSPSLFDDSSYVVDNEWFPMTPGTQLVFKGASGIGEDREGHGLVFIVTDLTKVIDGVRTAVLWERDTSAGELVEAELAFFAQDRAGNVWNFGEYPEEYEDGKLDKAPTWIGGIAGARTGIAMLAAPDADAPDYEQGYAPKPVDWQDRGNVRETGSKTCVPAGCYEDVLIIGEFELDKPGSTQLKYFAPGVGNVRVGWAGPKEDDHEILLLTEMRTLSEAEMADVREQVLALEAHGFQTSPDVYGTTPPLEPRPA